MTDLDEYQPLRVYFQGVMDETLLEVNGVLFKGLVMVALILATAKGMGTL